MAWGIQTNGINSFLEAASSWVPADLDNWSVEVLARRESGTSNAVLFAVSDFDDGIYIHSFSAGSVSLFVGGVQIAVATGTTFATGGADFSLIRADCVGGVVELKVDGASYGSAARGAITFSRNRTWFGARTGTSSYMHQTTQYVSLIDSNTPTNSRYYDADASDHSGSTDQPILTDTIGGNDAVGSGFPSFDASVWVDLGGSGVTVTAGTANYNYSGVAGTIDLTGEVIVTGQTASYDYEGVVASIDLGSEIIITGQTAVYNYTGVDGLIELTGLVKVTGKTAGYDYEGVAADITLQGSVIVTASTANYDYNALNATIILQGPITINPKNIIRVKRESKIMRVKRKSNTIIVR